MGLDAASWRSLHFVPAASEKMLAKARDLPADALILDLEDAVPPEGKQAARERVVEWLASAPSGAPGPARLVRINPLDSPWGRDDLERVVALRPDALVIPKAESAEQLARLDAALRECESAADLAPGSTALVLIATETPRALLRIEELGDAARVVALTWGAEDLSAALGGRRNRDGAGAYLPLYAHARWCTRLAAGAAGVAAIDGVYVDFRDLAGLAREAAEAADVGFTGKLTIHPTQIEVVHEAFTPSADEVARCAALLDAYEQHRSEGRGAFVFDGEMVDAPHLARARAQLERARRGSR